MDCDLEGNGGDESVLGSTETVSAPDAMVRGPCGAACGCRDAQRGQYSHSKDAISCAARGDGGTGKFPAPGLARGHGLMLRLPEPGTKVSLPPLAPDRYRRSSHRGAKAEITAQVVAGGADFRAEAQQRLRTACLMQQVFYSRDERGLGEVPARRAPS